MQVAYFLDAAEFSPELDHFLQKFRSFHYMSGEERFLRQYEQYLWAIADAADYVDASRLKFCALQYLGSKINDYLRGNNYLAGARKLLGFPGRMKGMYWQVSTDCGSVRIKLVTITTIKG